VTPEQQEAVRRAAQMAAIQRAQSKVKSGQPRLIATTPDNGEIYAMSDGSLSFKSPNFATTDQATIARLMEGSTPKEQIQRSVDEQRIAENPIAARVQEFNQGAPLVGEWMDNAVGMVSPRAAENMQRTSDAMERQRPGQSAALNIGGAIAYTVPALLGVGIKAGADFVARGGSALTQGLRAGTVAAPAGAVEGASSFAGRADQGGRAQAAATGAAVGGSLGFALGAVAPMVGEGVANLAKRVKRLDVSAIASEFGISPAAARSVKQALVNDDLDAAVARLGQLGDDAMLADAGPATQALLDASSKSGGRALAVTREAVEGRSQRLGARLPQRLDAILGDAGGIRAAARDISQRTAPARQAAYARAYATPINYADDAGRAIEETLTKVPSRVLKQAIDEANEEMTSLGIRNLQIMAEVGEDGSVVFREMPNVQQLDEIKKALDGIAREAVDQFGRPTRQGARYARLARELRAALGDAVPDYNRAVRIGGDKIKEDQALDMGRKLLWRNTTVEDVRAFVDDGMSDEARAAARRGLRETIEGTMSNVRRTITDPNTDAREAMTVVKELSSRANQEKLQLILGPGKANAILEELDKMATALTLRAAVAGNSATAIRQAVQGQVMDEATPNLAVRTLGNVGNPLEAAREVTQTIAGIDPRSMSQAQQEIFAEIADALTRIQGRDAQRALSAVRAAMAGQPMKDADAQLIGRLVAGSTAVGAYRAGTQPLAPQPR
jgi:hypothetical protein